MFYLDQMRGVPENSSNIYRTRDASKPLAKDSKGHFKIPSGFEISINMTSDTFLEEADDWRGDMWRIIRKRPDLIFYILTKRVHRVEQCLPEDWGEGYENVMMNISVENQRAFDERWPVLEKIPAKHKGINIAPMLS
jgi:protein gp37